MTEHSCLIICGTTKAATTSLFHYLADHPDVCASSIKETRFFLDADYPAPALPKYRLEHGMARYAAYFAHCQGAPLRLEATPDYLYSPGTPQRIKKSLSDVKLIFILREPIDRLVSWYRFAKQTARLPARVTFEEYVQLQLQDNGTSKLTEQHWRALKQGRYSVYLKPYFDLFERDCLYVAGYQALTLDPTSLLTHISRFAGIDPSFYQDYNSQIFNRTRTMKFAPLHGTWTKLRRGVRVRVYDRPRLHATLRIAYRQLEPLYLALNTRRDERVEMTETVRELLEDYYRPEPVALAHLLGCKQFSWLSTELLDLPFGVR